MRSRLVAKGRLATRRILSWTDLGGEDRPLAAPGPLRDTDEPTRRPSPLSRFIFFPEIFDAFFHAVAPSIGLTWLSWYRWRIEDRRPTAARSSCELGSWNSEGRRPQKSLSVTYDLSIGVSCATTTWRTCSWWTRVELKLYRSIVDIGQHGLPVNKFPPIQSD